MWSREIVLSNSAGGERTCHKHSEQQIILLLKEQVSVSLLHIGPN